MNRTTKRNLAAAGLLAAMALATAAPALAQSPAKAAPGVYTRQLNMGVGRSVIVDLPADAAEVFVAAPNVANAIVRSPRKLYIIAVAGGQTTITASDAQGRQIALIEVSTGRNIEELSKLLKTAMPKSEIRMQTVNDTIILSGNVDSPGDAQMAVDIAKGFVGGAAPGGAPGAAGGGDVINAIQVRGRDQVMVKVTIAEISRDVIKSVGITAASLTGSWGTFALDSPFGVNTVTSGSGLSLTGDKIKSTLKAFERNNVAHILAEPAVTAVSGENAKFTAGGEYPLSTLTCGTTNVCNYLITFKPYGVTLNFTPVVLAEGRIQLRIATEVSEIDFSHQVAINAGGSASSSVPGFLTRKNETTVELPSGGSIATAGLIQSHSASVVNGFPGLMNLPVLGSLFRSRDYQRGESELIIIATPYIVRPVAPRDLQRPTDNFADATDPQGVLLGRVNRIYSTTTNPQVIQNFKGKVGFIND